MKFLKTLFATLDGHNGDIPANQVVLVLPGSGKYFKVLDLHTGSISKKIAKNAELDFFSEILVPDKLIPMYLCNAFCTKLEIAASPSRFSGEGININLHVDENEEAKQALRVLNKYVNK